MNKPAPIDAEVRLLPEDRAVLEARLRAPTMEQRDVLPARIILLAAEGRASLPGFGARRQRSFGYHPNVESRIRLPRKRVLANSTMMALNGD
jgi:hypothetical protein